MIHVALSLAADQALSLTVVSIDVVTRGRGGGGGEGHTCTTAIWNDPTTDVPDLY